MATGIGDDFFLSYLEYAGAGKSEPPATFHRWTAVGVIAALLGRQAKLPFGHFDIYPNHYIMFMGSPGSRKSTAIGIGTKLLKQVGYTRFAADRTSKERFLMDMKQVEDGLIAADLQYLTLDEPAEIFVVADEFTDFIGANNVDFITMLTTLWDCKPEYKHPKIQGKSVIVNEPTVNILSGNTPQNFAIAFPPEALGNGFLSRLLLIHGEVTGRRVTFPIAPDKLLGEMLVLHLKEMRNYCKGEVTLSGAASKLCDRMYQEYVDIDDGRFKNYSTRRFIHLLKLAMIISCSSVRMEITEVDLLKANTMLYHAETKMSKALGEFGKSKYSEQSNSLLDLLNHAKAPMDMTELWKKLSQDLTKISDLGEIVKNLQHAGKIQQVNIKGKVGFLPLREQAKEWSSDLIIDSWLTLEERA